MRLSYYVFLLIAIVFATTSSAASTLQESKQNDISALTAEVEGVTRLLAANANARSLRATTKTDGDELSAEDEERAAPGGWAAKLSGVMGKMSAGIKNIPTSSLNGLFKSMDLVKITPAKLQKAFRITEKTPGRFQFLKKFEAFWNKKYNVVA
ncbi:hypothetical protein PHYBOEH_001818 [Phytophthora boehmeriae]|uniref:RxLR effector protein n=1 Tax=Phytophthora boehmeriae TaxID=109152 RepID=A0A8T1WRQ4_9STRA|nr:hypothetical protein PHYBOEH_001818 [Phytophthora boehmeriae]